MEQRSQHHGNIPLETPLLRSFPKHCFDSSKDGEFPGSSVADIVVTNRGKLRIVTAVQRLTRGALVSVAVQGASVVESATDPHIFTMRFGVGGRFRYESRRQPSGHARDIFIPPGTHFTSFGQGESSLVFALHRDAVERAMGANPARASGIQALPKHHGSVLRDGAFAAARALDRMPDDLRPMFLRNLQNVMAAGTAALLRTLLPDIRRPDPMIGRRKVADLREWAALDHDDPITVGDLAARCGLGLRALQKNFLRHFDTTPGEYLRGLRLDKARKLILSGAFTVTHAALEAGFVHLGHFSGNYEKRFGELPSVTAAISTRARA